MCSSRVLNVIVDVAAAVVVIAVFKAGRVFCVVIDIPVVDCASVDDKFKRLDKGAAVDAPKVSVQNFKDEVFDCVEDGNEKALFAGVVVGFVADVVFPLKLKLNPPDILNLKIIFGIYYFTFLIIL